MLPLPTTVRRKGGLTGGQVGVYGYGLHHNAPLQVPVSLSSAKRLHKTIRDNFGTIVFCRRYLERLGVERYLAGVGSSPLPTSSST